SGGVLTSHVDFTTVKPGGFHGFSVQKDIQARSLSGGAIPQASYVDQTYLQITPPLASLSGFVWNDTADNNGIKEAGEPGISGSVVTLTGKDYLGNPVNATSTTDVNGFYKFTGLQAGTYKLTQDQPAGYVDGKDTIGTPGGTTGHDQFSNIVLDAGINGTQN